MKRIDKEPRSLLEILTGKKRPESDGPVEVTHGGRVKKYVVEKGPILRKVFTTIETPEGTVAVLETVGTHTEDPDKIAVVGKNGQIRAYQVGIAKARPGESERKLMPLRGERTAKGNTRQGEKPIYAGVGNRFAQRLADHLFNPGYTGTEKLSGAEDEIHKVFSLPRRTRK